LFLMAIAFHLAYPTLELKPAYDRYENTIFWILLGLQVFLWANIVIDFFIQRIIQEKTTTENYHQFLLTSGPVRIIIQILTAIIVIIIVLDMLGVNVTGLLAGLGVGGIALALAVQNILKDLLSALSIALDKPFVEGDFIVIGDKMGTVERVGLQTTRLRALSGEQLVINNGDILSSRVQNYKRMQNRRLEVRFTLVYQTPKHLVEKVPGIIKEVITPIPKTTVERTHFKDFGESGLIFEYVYWVIDPDFNLYMDIQQQINLALMERFEAEGIGFATPMRTIQILHDTPAGIEEMTSPENK
ncbi:MAG: MscS Mechanosensitive ion channel, partial [Alphaproteobacteria bacterium]|nr:MscS Mechanosensitive ion channel [Alphaproteobacteria bacterium]